MRRKTRGGAPLAALAFLPLLLCPLALAAFGGEFYRAVSGAYALHSAARAGLGYLCTRLRAADAAGAVRVVDGPQGDALLLADGGTGYETRIYLYDGALLEQYSSAESDFTPADAQPITETATFSATMEGNLVTLQTGEGTALVALHSEGEAGA